MLHVFLTILQMVAYLSPTVLAIIFAIILFSNLDSANYAFGDSNACIIVWILYTLIALSCSLSFILYRLFKWELNHKSAIKATIASVIISTVASIAGFISLAQIKPDFKFDPASQISIKTTKTSYRTTGGFYYTTISFTITNNCPYAIQSISGYLDVFNGDNLVVSDHYVSFYESFNPDTTVDVDCTMYFSNTDLYKTTYSSMKIDFSYSNIEFGSGYKQSFYRDNLVINIK